jgi:hypothetical protein
MKVGDRVRYEYIPGLTYEGGEAIVVDPCVRVYEGMRIAVAMIHTHETFEFYADELELLDRSEVGTFPFLSPGPGRV